MADSQNGLNTGLNIDTSIEAQCATKASASPQHNDAMKDDLAGRLDNPLWQYACQIYAKPGVERALLELQDSHGADINVILQSLWLASQGHAWSPTHVSNMYTVWMSEQIQPLRLMRRKMKDEWVAKHGQEFEGFRQQVKTLELQAEQYGLAMLFVTTFDEQEGHDVSVTTNLKRLGQNMNILPKHFLALIDVVG